MSMLDNDDCPTNAGLLVFVTLLAAANDSISAAASAFFFGCCGTTCCICCCIGSGCFSPCVRVCVEVWVDGTVFEDTWIDCCDIDAVVIVGGAARRVTCNDAELGAALVIPSDNISSCSCFDGAAIIPLCCSSVSLEDRSSEALVCSALSFRSFERRGRTIAGDEGGVSVPTSFFEATFALRPERLGGVCAPFCNNPAVMVFRTTSSMTSSIVQRSFSCNRRDFLVFAAVMLPEQATWSIEFADDEDIACDGCGCPNLCAVGTDPDGTIVTVGVVFADIEVAWIISMVGISGN